MARGLTIAVPTSDAGSQPEPGRPMGEGADPSDLRCADGPTLNPADHLDDRIAAMDRVRSPTVEEILFLIRAVLKPTERRSRWSCAHRSLRYAIEHPLREWHESTLPYRGRSDLRQPRWFWRPAEAPYVDWYNADRPHSWLAGRAPDEIYHGSFPACRRPRFEPRTRWPRRSPCA